MRRRLHINLMSYKVLTRLLQQNNLKRGLIKGMQRSSNPIPLVIRVPNISIPLACQRVLDGHKDRVAVVTEDYITNDNRKMVQGILTYNTQNIDSNIMASFPCLRVVSNCFVGTDNVDIKEATRRGIKVGNTPGVAEECIADQALALLLASARNIVVGDAICKHPNTKEFDCDFFGKRVTGSTIGIIGLGSIGTAVAKRAKGFDMKILYYGRKRKENLEKLTSAEYCHQLTDLLKQADFVVLCVPLTPDTKHLISAPELSAMKPSATLINIARGDVVNHDDLVKALHTGQIRAAALDVTSPEPLPRDHPLLKLPNVIMSPHNATATEYTRLKMVAMAMENIVAGIGGFPLPSSVN